MRRIGSADYRVETATTEQAEKTDFRVETEECAAAYVAVQIMLAKRCIVAVQ
jgi:hypothetical protein